MLGGWDMDRWVHIGTVHNRNHVWSCLIQGGKAEFDRVGSMFGESLGV